MTTLFISDLHLDEALPRVTALLDNFVDSEVAGADALYILGDLFEVWIGDDDDRPATLRFLDILRKATATGTPVYFMHGNRDFLVGEQFSKATGIRLIADPTVIELDGKRVLLMHGDSLCTDDTEHQKTRAILRSREWQADFLGKPLHERVELARQYRQMSRAHTSMNPDAIKDVNQQAVIEAMREHHVDELIHGHTHRPAIHELETGGKPARRIVLGDWNEKGSVLRASGKERNLETWPA